MVRTEFDLAVVLTKGFVQGVDSRWYPDDGGVLRLKKAASLLVENPTMRVCFTGGILGNPGYSAEVYEKWFRTSCPRFEPRIFLTSARGGYTARDMEVLLEDLQVRLEKSQSKLKRLLLISHPDHTSLASMTLVALARGSQYHIEIVEVDSGEPPPYSRPKQIILNWVTVCDPCWEKLPSLPLRYLANKRGK